MAEQEIHVGDIGTIFEVEVIECNLVTGLDEVVDISASTTMQLKFQKSGGTTITKTASFSDAGVDGKIRYVSVSGDLDQPGQWRLQAYLISPSWTLSSSIGCFEVFPNL